MSDVSTLFRSIQPVDHTTIDRKLPDRPSTKPSEFEAILDEKVGKVKLSQHAETRIQSRSLPWNQEIEERVEGGIELARSKGSREALILTDQLAVIANVKSNTVVTAMDRTQLSKGRIFTNIDSTVLV